MDSAPNTVEDDPNRAREKRMLFRRLGESRLTEPEGTPPEGEEITIRDQRPGARPAEDASLRLATAETAHDFNNLLSVILSCASELETGTSAEISRERGAEIRAAAERGARLARELIETAKPKPRTPAPTDLNAALERSHSTLARTLGPGIRFSLEPASWTPNVLLHEEELEKILLNLAGNARDALDGAGAFTLRTQVVSVRAGDPVLSPGWHVLLSACDDGPGMSEPVRARALEPFYTTKAGRRGNGLGLPTIAEIARSRDGDLRIHSQPGKGTTVTVLLPSVRSNGDPLTLRPRA